MIVKRVGALSFGRVWATLYGAFGMIIGTGLSLYSLSRDPNTRGGAEGLPWLEALFGAGAVVTLPIAYGVVGFVGGLVTALVYNWMAKAVGGLEIEVE